MPLGLLPPLGAVPSLSTSAGSCRVPGQHSAARRQPRCQQLNSLRCTPADKGRIYSKGFCRELETKSLLKGASVQTCTAAQVWCKYLSRIDGEHVRDRRCSL